MTGSVSLSAFHESGGGFDLPGRPWTSYTVPSASQVEYALVSLILRRGGVDEQVCRNGLSTERHAALDALAELGDRHAAAFLRRKGFNPPPPLAPQEPAPSVRIVLDASKARAALFGAMATIARLSRRAFDRATVI